MEHKGTVVEAKYTKAGTASDVFEGGPVPSAVLENGLMSK